MTSCPLRWKGIPASSSDLLVQVIGIRRGITSEFPTVRARSWTDRPTFDATSAPSPPLVPRQNSISHFKESFCLCSDFSAGSYFGFKVSVGKSCWGLMFTSSLSFFTFLSLLLFLFYLFVNGSSSAQGIVAEISWFIHSVASESSTL